MTGMTCPCQETAGREIGFTSAMNIENPSGESRQPICRSSRVLGHSRKPPKRHQHRARRGRGLSLKYQVTLAAQHAAPLSVADALRCIQAVKNVIFIDNRKFEQRRDLPRQCRLAAAWKARHHYEQPFIHRLKITSLEG